MIRAEKLSRQYGFATKQDGGKGDAFFAVKDLSFHVHKGEVMGLLGPNGAGKSTTMKMLTCSLPPSSGTASVNDVSLDDDIQVRRHIGYLPEQAPLYVDLDVRSHLRFIARLHGLSAATADDRIREMAGLCGLEHVLNRRIDELSKGYRQRVGLAASMLHDPICLILDEPTTGLDPNQIIEIRHLIRRLGEQKTVLLSSHVLSEVEAVCDKVMIINQGQLQCMGTPQALARQAKGGASLHILLRGDVDVFRQQVQLLSSDCIVEEDKQQDLPQGEHRLRLHAEDGESALAEIAFQAAVAGSMVLLEMQPENTSLEDVFHQLTGGQS